MHHFPALCEETQVVKRKSEMQVNIQGQGRLFICPQGRSKHGKSSLWFWIPTSWDYPPVGCAQTLSCALDRARGRGPLPGPSGFSLSRLGCPLMPHCFLILAIVLSRFCLITTETGHRLVLNQRDQDQMYFFSRDISDLLSLTPLYQC